MKKSDPPPPKSAKRLVYKIKMPAYPLYGRPSGDYFPNGASLTPSTLTALLKWRAANDRMNAIREAREYDKNTIQRAGGFSPTTGRWPSAWEDRKRMESEMLRTIRDRNENYKNVNFDGLTVPIRIRHSY